MALVYTRLETVQKGTDFGFSFLLFTLNEPIKIKCNIFSQQVKCFLKCFLQYLSLGIIMRKKCFLKAEYDCEV